MLKKSIIWVVAILLTFAAAYYQRKTGPTYPVDATATLNGEQYRFELIRSHGGETDAEVMLPVTDEAVSGTVYYKRFGTDDEFTPVPFQRSDDGKFLVAPLPNQPPAGKLDYYLVLTDAENEIKIAEKTPITVRFKGDVPAWVLIPHIILIFAAMLISTVAGILALTKEDSYRFYTYLALILLTVGGMIFGPLVQQYAFGTLWAGVPFGWDLTDNKTLIAFIAFLIAVLGIRKADRRYLVVAAAVILLVVFSIPHSIMGSSLDYSTGKIGTH